jgi:hypothetical protein
MLKLFNCQGSSVFRETLRVFAPALTYENFGLLNYRMML